MPDDIPSPSEPIPQAEPDSGRSIFDHILDQTRDGICIQDVYGRVEWVNPACEKMFGWSLDDARGRRSQELVLPLETRPPKDVIANFRYEFDSSLFGRHLISENIRRDGSRFWNQQTFSVINLGPDEDQTKIVVTCRDVTDQVNTDVALQRVQVDLQHAAFHDDLTGLANRKKLTEELNSNRGKHLIARGWIGVLQLDIDKFKEINDTLGHAAGDATLCHVAKALQACGRTSDLVCRTGGDEFLLVCFGPTSKADLMTRANQALEAIRAPLNFQGQVIRISASIGISRPIEPGNTGETLIQQADQALYCAKSQGRDHAVFFTRELGKLYKDQQNLLHDLTLALTGEQFEVYLQPQLALAENRVVGCEALIRWRRPGHGLQPPIAFLQAAEKGGLLTEIDYVAMNLALDALVALHKSGFHDMCMSINVSSSILSDMNYPGLLDWGMQSRDIQPQNVCIEILETTILDTGDIDIIRAIEQLKHLGVQISLDDFGTGYAGLAHMSAFEIDAIKLDRSMIARLQGDPRNRVIIRSIIQLCRQLGVKVVAEGVETQTQLELLRHARCPLIQGYGLAYPMPVQDFISWLRENRSPRELPRFDLTETTKNSIPPCLRNH